MNKLSLILLFFCSFNELFGQSICGKIIDSESLAEVEYATITIPNKQFGIVSDIQGCFNIDLNKIEKSDFIYASALGYFPDSILLNSGINTDTLVIKLKRKNFQLNEVVIHSQKIKSIKLGIDNTPKRIMWNYGLPGLQRAIFIDNKKNNKNLFISSVGVYIDTIGFSQTPLRIRILSKSENGLPDKDLLESNVILRNSIAGEYNIIDLSEYQIAFPTSGAFVSIEWIEEGEEFYYTKKIVNGNKPPFELKGYGPTLGIISSNDNSKYWKKLVGKQWGENSKNSNKIHPMIYINLNEIN